MVPGSSCTFPGFSQLRWAWGKAQPVGQCPPLTWAQPPAAVRVLQRKGLASSGMGLPLEWAVPGAGAKVEVLPGLGWIKRGTHTGHPVCASLHCCSCAGSRVPPLFLLLNFKLSPLPSQQDTPLPRLQSYLPPSPPPPHPALPLDASQLPHVGLALLLPQGQTWQREKRLQEQLYLGILPQFLFH